MEKSEQLNELAAALCKAQSQMQGAHKSSENPYFKSKYADLQSCWEALRKPLSDNGLSIVQTLGPTSEIVFLETMLLHTSGQWVLSAISIRPVKPDPQAYGSAISYARRYALAAITGLYSLDDDGNEASSQHKAPPVETANLTPQYLNPAVAASGATANKQSFFVGGAKNSTITEKQFKFLGHRLQEASWTLDQLANVMINKYGANNERGYFSCRTMTMAQLDDALAIIKNLPADALQEVLSRVAPMPEAQKFMTDEDVPF